MEERRTALRLAAATLGLTVAGAATLLASPARACTPPVEGTRLESARHVLTYKVPAVQVGAHFALDVSACAKSGPAPEALKVDAHMPAHRHGMNYAPKVSAIGPGTWRAEGFLFHMPGGWELVFELRSGGVSDVLRSSFEVSGAPDFSPEEKKKILAHGPWPPKLARDPSNRVSGRIEAVAFGERLFFEPRLSGTGTVPCSGCHVPGREWQDGRPRGIGLAEVDRNTQGLMNVRFQRWFGWDGAGDSLWAQSIRPLLDEREMASSAPHVARLLREDPSYRRGYERVFQRPPPSDDEELLADAGKALAAFQETLVTGRTPFDEFRDALERNDLEGMRRYPAAARRGLRIFVGKGNCSVCHFGPQFTNGEFADTGVPFFTPRGAQPGVDAGRHQGIRRLKQSAFNLLGRFNDDPARASATGTRHVELQHRNFGEFRVPGLRDVARTAPYMHNGSLSTLSDVVAFYSDLDEERLHADGEKILRPLRLSPAEAEELLAFLESLSTPGPAVAVGRRP
jgi:cytochrome c peroxidase